MELKQIKELMSAMGRSGITKIVLKKEGEFELQLEREGNEGGEKPNLLTGGQNSDGDFQSTPFALPRAPELPVAVTHMGAPIASPVKQADESGKFVTSPMVGTLYTSPSPDDPSFVKVGDVVAPNTVVCIIEAMKVMNEVKAGVNGTIAEILATNGQPVEFGTKLFRVI